MFSSGLGGFVANHGFGCGLFDIYLYESNFSLEIKCNYPNL